MQRIIAKNIALLRVRTGLSKSEFAKKLKISPTNIPRLETPQNFTIDTIERIAKVLKVEPYELLLDSDGDITEKDGQNILEFGIESAEKTLEILKILRKK